MANHNHITKEVKFGQRYIAGISKKVIDAEALHKWLGIKNRFRSWMDRRVEEYRFNNNEDYLLVEDKPKGRGRPKKTYWLTIDMAKELSMLEKNDKGREARKYFLECEKLAIESLKNKSQLPVVQDISVRKAQIVLYYADGDIEAKPFDQDNINLACSHLMPDSVVMDRDQMFKTILPLQESVAAGLTLLSDMSRSLKGDGVV